MRLDLFSTSKRIAKYDLEPTSPAKARIETGRAKTKATFLLRCLGGAACEHDDASSATLMSSRYRAGRLRLEESLNHCATSRTADTLGSVKQNVAPSFTFPSPQIRPPCR